MQFFRFRIVPNCASRNSSFLSSISRSSKHQYRSIAAHSESQPSLTHLESHAPPTGPEGVYIHLPFCKRRCYYCDFPIQVIGSRTSKSTNGVFTDYVNLLETEIQRSPIVGTGTLKTISFGGGTPSLMPPGHLERLINCLNERFDFTSDLEMSLEADPGTFGLTQLEEYVKIGVTRFSLGVQSFDSDVLSNCGRSHSIHDIYRAVTDLQTLAPNSWSLDLISGLPHVDLDRWRFTLQEAIGCQPDHMSIYDLQVEVSTPFNRWYSMGYEPLPSMDQAAEMYKLAVELLSAAGYDHYEISNYAKEGHRSRHNLLYWKNRPFYAFGLGATSCTNGVRISRPKKLKEYASWVANLPQGHSEPFTWTEDVFETIMLHLRLKDGLNLEHFCELHGIEKLKKVIMAIEEFTIRGLVECLDHDHQLVPWSEDLSRISRIRLNDPDGFLISNEILSTIFTHLE
eukprot:g3804.t1